MKKLKESEINHTKIKSKTASVNAKKFDLEFSTTAIGEVIVYVDVKTKNVGCIEQSEIISAAELKVLIDNLTVIHSEITKQA